MTIRATLLRRLTAPVRAFHRDETASLSAEAAIIAPLLFWAFLAVYAYFDVYRVKNIALKSNYAISDLLSRETEVIDMDYLNGVADLYNYLTQGGTDTWLRFTVVHCTDNCTEEDGPRTLAVDWSRATDGQPTFSDTDVMTQLNDVIPLIAAGERVIIVETTLDYDAPFASSLTGITDQRFTDIVMTRPRFAPQLCLEGVGCGA